MNVIFAGTPDFAARALRAVGDAGHDVRLVLTRHDKPAGRGLSTQISAVKRLAEERGLALHQPATLKQSEELQPLREAGADIMVVAAYGLILPQCVLDIAPRGAINIHASLLPRWRGAAPIQRAIMAGDTHTGISIMQMDAGLDTGPVLATSRTPIGDEDTAGSLEDRLAGIGAQLVVESLRAIERGATAACPQEEGLATYASKIQKAEARLDWARPAAQNHRWIRALNPAPGAFTLWDGAPLKIWGATMDSRFDDRPGRPGEVLEAGLEGIVVACGQGALRLTELQRAGARRLAVADFVRGVRIAAGACFQ